MWNVLTVIVLLLLLFVENMEDVVKTAVKSLNLLNHEH